MNFDRIYAYRFRDVDQVARARVWTEIARYLHRRLGEPSRVLDPAAGLGEFIANSPAAERWAVDMIDHGLSKLDGVTVRIQPILEADLPDAYFDAVFASNLLEHFASPDEIAQFLERMYALLRPGGVLAVMGPNFRYCSRDYFDCADHVLALTHVAVSEHLYGAGFEVDSVTPRFLPYSFRSALPASARLTRAYLKMPLLWKVLGKQFLVIGRRPT
ncbi:MAG: class I SAM-dependent methyltransferase [Ilumatobacteraceae bacterium]